MRFQGFIGPSYNLRSVNVDCQRCINLYPEMDELQTEKDGEVAALIGTPGLSLLATIGLGPVRGAWFTTTGLFFVVSGNTLYSVTSAWIATSVGTLLSSSGPVSMADNGIQLVIVDGTYGYYVTLATPTTLTQITDVHFTGSKTVSVQDSYFIFCDPTSGSFYLSDLNAITFTAPANTTKNGYPDKTVAFITSSRNAWFLGDRTSEVWFDAGSNNNPFQYTPGSMFQYGCVSPYAVAKMANTLFWLAKDETGQGIVVMAEGFSPKRISTHGVELSIQGYSTISDAIAWSYQDGGHQFFVLTFPTGNATWVYDVATGMWHERAFTSGGLLGRHRANCHAFAFGTHVVGDYLNGNIYSQSLSTYSDNGSAITRRRTAPHLSKGMARLFHSKFQLDFESGVGLDGTTQGTDPQAVLRWSDDGGHKWSSEQWRSMGAIGATIWRSIWRRLGHSRSRVYELTITDPVKVVLIGAEIEVEEGAA